MQLKQSLMYTAMALALAAPAMAANGNGGNNGNNGNGNNGNGGGGNHSVTITASPSATATANPVINSSPVASATGGTGGNATSRATGGNATSRATGGNATGGNATGGNATGGNSTGGAATANGGTTSATGGQTSIVNNNSYSGGDPPAATGAAAGAADPSGGHYTSTVTVRNTPDIFAPSIVGGNLCAVGASGGLGLPGFGLTLGASWASRQCELRQLAALMHNMGHDSTDAVTRASLETAAVEVLCTNEDVRAALKRAAHPCVQDQPQVALAATPVATAPVAPPAPRKPVPSWCSPETVSAAHLATLAEPSADYIKRECGV